MVRGLLGILSLKLSSYYRLLKSDSDSHNVEIILRFVTLFAINEK